MRTLVAVLVCSSLYLCLPGPALGQDPGFEASYRGEATGSIEIGRIDVSPGLRQKAEQLGEAELARLTGYLREELESTLVAASWHGIASHETVLNVMLVDVIPNRPTLAQIQQLDTTRYSGLAPGGAELTAELLDASGHLIGQYRFRWYNPDPSGAGNGIWSDTRLAFSLFARALTDSLGDAPLPRAAGR